ELLAQEASQGNTEAEYNKAKLDYEANLELAKSELIADIIVKKSKVTVQELESKNQNEKQKIDSLAKSSEARIGAQQARVDQLRVAYDLRKKQLDELKVRAGVAGVVQQVPVEAGQRVMPGTILAKVAEPGRLKAEIQIAETQVKDVVPGQPA